MTTYSDIGKAPTRSDGKNPSGTFSCCQGYGSHVAERCPLIKAIGGRESNFWDRVAIKAGECWDWQGYVRPNGYGQFASVLLAHRVAYELARGPIPDGLTIDHLCFNKVCVNPDHLEAVTQAENNRRSVARTDTAHNKNKTHCPNGHPYDEENTYVLPAGGRACQTCRREKRGVKAPRKRGVTPVPKRSEFKAAIARLEAENADLRVRLQAASDALFDLCYRIESRHYLGGGRDAAEADAERWFESAMEAGEFRRAYDEVDG